jgi:carbon-monoxide dehydrogenase medium subunit
MISTAFEFHAPTRLDDALTLVAEHGARAKVLAGGMSLMPTLNLGLVKPEVVISLNHIGALRYIKEDGDFLKIGAMTKHSQIGKDALISRHCPLLAEASHVIGDAQVRHRGTIGGSIAHADPAADYLPVMVVLDARLRLQSRGRDRTVKAGDFFVDIMRTSLEPGELLVEVQVPKMSRGAGAGFVRLARVEGSYAIVNAAAIVNRSTRLADIAIGGVGPKPARVRVTLDRPDDPSRENLDRIGQAAYDACEDAYGDLSGDAKYRRAMARVYAQRAVKEAISKSR